MNDIIKLLLVITFCIGAPLALAVSAWAYVLLVANKNKATADTTNQMIVFNPPVAWIIKNFIGWIYVLEGKQIGVVGNKVYRKSGLFLESFSGSTEKYILSCLPYHMDISVTTTTRDPTQIKVDAIIEYSARPEKVKELRDAGAGPIPSMNKKLESNFIKLIQEYDFDSLMEKRDQVELDFKLNFEKKLPFYNFDVTIKVDGERVQQRSNASTRLERLDNAYIEMQEQIIRGGADIAIDGAKREQEFRQKREALKETQNLFSTDQPPRPARNINGNMSPNKQIGEINSSAFYDELKNASRDSQMQLLTDSSPYRMLYNDHGIQLEIDETKGSVSLEIWNRKAKIASVTQPLNISLQALLLAARKRIDSEVSRRQHD